MIWVTCKCSGVFTMRHIHDLRADCKIYYLCFCCDKLPERESFLTLIEWYLETL